MFYEVHSGYVGLGAATVFRTARQAASDIQKFGKDVMDTTVATGLLDMQSVFKYSTTQGRLADLQQEVENLGNKLSGLQQQLSNVVSELEHLGVMKAGDFAKMGAKMVVGAKIPIIGWLSLVSTLGGMFGIDLSFLDVFDFGGAKKKKKKAQELMKRAEALMKEMAFWADRRDMLQKEGESLAKTVQEKGEGGVQSRIVELQTKYEYGKPVDRMRSINQAPVDVSQAMEDIRMKKTYRKDVKERQAYGMTVMATGSELEKRMRSDKVEPAGDRLPVGFQTIYSPILEGGRIVAKVAQPNTTLPGPVDRKVVYGGLLSGLSQSEGQNVAITSALVVGILLYFTIGMKKQ